MVTPIINWELVAMNIDTKDQYREVAASLRQHDQLIWQIPAIAVVVDGGLLISTFGLIESHLARSLLLFISVILTAILGYSLLVHRHWADVRRKTLAVMERDSRTQPVHWAGSADKDTNYWYSERAPWWYKYPASHVFFVGLCVIETAILVALGNEISRAMG